MSYTVNQIYEYTDFLTNKYQSGSITPSDLFYAWNSEQKAYMSDLIGNWHNRNNTKTGMNTGMVEDRRIRTILSPFTITDGIDIINSEINKPDDFLYLLALRYGLSRDIIFEINQDQISNVVNSVIDTPSTATGTFYYYQAQNKFYVLPTGITGQVEIDYIAMPRDIVWGYTYDTDGRQMYDSNTSVQPLWDDTTIVEITKRTLASLGVRFNSQDFENFGKTTIATGD